MTKPLIGITMDLAESGGRLKADCSMAYSRCVMEAGGVPIMLPPIASLIDEHLRLCDGFVLTGGDDPKMEAFGVPTHPMAKVIHPDRQAYELGLLEALRSKRPDTPVLGICLGMQLMALHEGGRLNQFLPETLASHAMHKNAEHAVAPLPGSGLPRGIVWSNHRQAIDEPGQMTVIARSSDGVIEAVSGPRRRFCMGVQWHPERTGDAGLGGGVFGMLVGKCGEGRRG